MPAAAPPRWLTPRLAPFRTDGPRVRDFAGRYCRLTRGAHAGQLVRLRPWQAEIVDDLYELRPDGRRRRRVGLVGMPRKNSKSLLGSILALYGLIGDGEAGAEVYSAAGDKDQAKIVFGEARRMIEAEARLALRLQVYKDAIEDPQTGSVYRALSAEAFSKEGLNPSLVVFDEVHVQPSDELWDVLNLGSGTRRDPLVLGITTAGQLYNSLGAESLCYRLYQHGRQVAAGEVDDPFFYFRWYEPADPDGDHRDPQVWAGCNPGFGDFLYPDDFASVVKRTPEPEFRTKRLNQWQATMAAWFPYGAWDACADPDREVPDGAEVVAAFDGSYSGDSTALVGCVPPTPDTPPHLFVIDAWEADPADPGWRVDIADVEAAIVAACQRWRVRELPADPYRWAEVLQRLAAAGLPYVEYSQSPVRMVPACTRLYEAVMERRVTHDGDPRLARHVAAAALKVDRQGPRIVKDARAHGSGRRIDLAVAAVMAHDRAVQSTGDYDPLESVW